MHLLRSLVLARVEYALFESDAARLDDNPGLSFHEVDREVRLIDHLGASSYISWVDYGEFYEVAVRDKSFFTQPPGSVRDMSQSRLWQHFVGHEIGLYSITTPTTYLMIRSADHQICCCCFERGSWGVDVLHIARDLPKMGAT